MRGDAAVRAALTLGPLLVSLLALISFGTALPDPDPYAPWALIALLTLPGLLWAPGLGWAAWLSRDRPTSRLQLGLDAAWISLGITWIDVALARELGLRGSSAAWGHWAFAALWALGGLWLARSVGPARPSPRREALAGAAVLLAVLGLAAWKHVDLARPLDGYWYLTGADEEGREALPLEPGDGWTRVEAIGWPESGAQRLTPETTRPTLMAPEGARGRVALAIRGPVNSRITVDGRSATVEPSVTELPEEGPVRRYLRDGVAGLLLEVDLAPGEELTLELDAVDRTVYLLPGTDAVWSLHATGALRYVHYYQLLNQVENQVWAEELLDSRWITLNQPPGWSPILALAVLWVRPDLQAANALFLGVLLLVGLGSARLMLALAPEARGPALLLPAAMTLAHGLLMIEPGSTNFPDSLYAASLIAVALALVEGRAGWFGALGVAAAILRYPGGPVVLILAALWRLCFGSWPLTALRHLGLSAGVAALLGLALLLGGHMEDVGFIVYFEIFPEHWHGDYSPGSLLPRIPDFYASLLTYSGGAGLLALAGLGAPGAATRRATAFLLGAFGAYSLVLCTVDHHPSHYFLPLVAASGVALGVASAGFPRRGMGTLLPTLGLIGVALFLYRGQV